MAIVAVVTTLALAPLAAVAAPAVVNTILVGGQPAEVAFTPDGSSAYVLDGAPRADTVSVIVTATKAVSQITVGDSPAGVAFSPDGKTAYITNRNSDSVSVIDVAGGVVLATVLVGAQPRGVAVSPDGRKIYVADSGANTVSVIDAANNLRVGQIFVRDRPALVAFATRGPNAGSMYVSHSYYAELSVVVNDAVTAKIDLPGPATDLAITPDGTKVYTSYSPTSETSAISIIEVSSGLVSGNIILSRMSAARLAFFPNGDRAYAVGNSSYVSGTSGLDRGYLATINVATGSVTSTVGLGALAYAVAIAPDSTRAYVTDAFYGKVSIVTAAPLASMKITPTATEAYVGEPQAFQAMGTDTQGNDLGTQSDVATFSSSNASDTVNRNVVTFGESTGSRTITATARLLKGGDSIKATTTFKVVEKPFVESTFDMSHFLTLWPDTSAAWNLAVTPDASRVFVTRPKANVLTMINSETKEITNFALQSSATGIAITTDGARIYVAEPAAGALQVVTWATGQVSAPIKVGNSPMAVAVSPNGHWLAVTDMIDNTVSRISVAGTAPLAVIPVGGSPTAVAFTPDSTLALVANSSDNSVTVISVSTGTKVSSFTVGNDPRSIAFAPDGRTAYVANYGSNTVSVIGLSRGIGVVTGTISVGLKPWGVAISPDGKTVLVTNSGEHTTSVIRVLTGTVGTSVLVGVAPQGVAFSSDGFKAFVLNTVEGTVSVIVAGVDTSMKISPRAIAVQAGAVQVYRTTATTAEGVQLGSQTRLSKFTSSNSSDNISGNTVFFGPKLGVRTITATNGAVSVSTTATVGPPPVVEATLPTSGATAGQPQIAVSPDGKKVYATEPSYGLVKVLDTATQVFSSIYVGGFPSGIAISGDGKTVFVTDPVQNSVSVINVDTGLVTAQIGVGLSPARLAISPDGKVALVANVGSDYLTQIDVSSRKAVASIGVGSGPLDIVFTADSRFAYVTNFTSGTVSRVSIVGGYETDTISVGAHPIGIAIPSRNSTVAFVANQGSNTVSVINLAAGKVTATIPVGSNPTGLAASPDGTRVYVANMADGTVSVIRVSTGSMMAVIQLGDPNIFPYAVAFSTDGTKAYTVNSSGSISVISVGR